MVMRGQFFKWGVLGVRIHMGFCIMFYACELRLLTVFRH